jgi:hypothetical protein
VYDTATVARGYGLPFLSCTTSGSTRLAGLQTGGWTDGHLLVSFATGVSDRWRRHSVVCARARRADTGGRVSREPSHDRGAFCLRGGATPGHRLRKVQPCADPSTAPRAQPATERAQP